MQEKIREVMATTLEVRPEDLTEKASIDTIETWDSLHHMMLMIALEKAFDLKFDEAEVTELLSYETISEAIARRKN